MARLFKTVAIIILLPILFSFDAKNEQINLQKYCTKNMDFPNFEQAIPNQNQEYRLPIIMYHSTHPKNVGTYNISPKQLEKDIEYLVQQGFCTVNVADLIDFCKLGKPLPHKPIMLTFDDGYLNNYLYAYPLFCKYQQKCVMSVVGQLTDKNYSCSKGTQHAHVNYEQIREMSQSGFVEIQNHTDKLHRLDVNCGMKKSGESIKQYENRLKSDILSMHQKLKDNSGVICTAVAYPFGSYSKKLSATFLQDIGYSASFTCTEKVNTIKRHSSLFNLCRFNRPHGKSSKEFFEPIEKLC